MKVLFDHNTPAALAKYLTGHTISFADDMGWSCLQNGELIAAAESNCFEVFISGDKNLQYQQQVVGRKLAIVSLSAINWPVIQPHLETIRTAVDAATPGSF